MSVKNKLGQYFTKNILLKEKLYSFMLNDSINILEPSIGRGDLIDYVIQQNKLKDQHQNQNQNQNINIVFDMYEIDNTIELLDSINKNDVKFENFMDSIINKKYSTIIGNPPYIRTKTGNLYINFIEKCYNLLDNNGEMIFIIPSDLFKLTSASKILNVMMHNGTFTHIFHPHNEKLFENASIDVIIFRYCKNTNLDSKIANTIIYNDKLMNIVNSNGMITFCNANITNNENIANNLSNLSINVIDSKVLVLFKDYFDIYVGIVSGRDDVYKNAALGNINVITGNNKTDKFIFINKFPCNNEDINSYLLQNKNILISRKIKQFNDKNWFEWGAPRNIKTIEIHKGKSCIYLYNLSRKSTIAFKGTIDYFGGNLIMLKPKNNDIYNLDKIILYLNSDDFKLNFMFSGRFKIGHRQISYSLFDKKIIIDN